MTEGNAQHPQELLLDYVESQLEDHEQVRLRRHLDECESCTEEVATLREGLREITRFYLYEVSPNLPAPPQAWKNLPFDQSSTEANSPHRVSRSKRWRGALGLAGLGTLAAATLFVSHWRPEPSNIRSAQAPQSPDAAPKPSVSAKRAPISPQPAPIPPVEAAPDPNTELRIFSALHRLNADTGDPVDVEFHADAWQVSVLGWTEARVAVLDQELRALPNVRLLRKDSSGFDPRRLPPPAPAGEPQSVSKQPFKEELDRYFGSRAALEAFTNRALDHSEIILARAHAIDVLDQRFNVERLGLEERRMLATMRDDHRIAIRKELGGIEKDFEILDGALSLPDATSPSPVRILKSAEQWDHLLGIVLGGSVTDQSPSQLRAALARAATDLRRAIAEIQ